MATNDIHIDIAENQVRVPLPVGSRTLLRSVEPNDGSPYYVGARAYVTQTASGAIITVIDKDGTTTATIDNGEDGVGISDISLTSTSGNVDTYTITYTNGNTDTFTVTNGVDGQDGADGADGFSPSATVSKVGTTTTITITDKDGTTTATVEDGSGAGIFVAEYYVTTYADVKDAWDAEQNIVCKMIDGDDTVLLPLIGFDGNDYVFYFCTEFAKEERWAILSQADGWDDYTNSIAQVNADWNETQVDSPALILNKPTIPARNIWYGECTTNSSSSPKVVTTSSGDFSLTAGNMLVVKFSNTNQLSSASLQVDGGTSKSAYAMDGTSDISNRWGSGEVVMFAYDGTKFILLEQGKASTTQYGITKLNNTTSSTSTTEAATANAVKSAYDHGGVQSVNGSTGAVTLTIPTVPTNVSDFVNDAGYLTSESDPVFTASAAYGIASGDITAWNGKSDFSGSYTDLTDKPTIPSNTSDLNNDSGFTSVSLTRHTTTGTNIADLTIDGTTTKLYAPTGGGGGITDVEVDGTSVVTGGVASIDLTGKSDVGHTHTCAAITDFPTTVSSFTNDAGYLTSFTETDPIFTASDAYGISSSDISNWNDKLDATGILNLFYPVGSYYETSDTSFDPNISWGGTWSLETEGQVHISGSVSGTYQVSGALTDTSDGGSEDAVLVSHDHTASGGAVGNNPSAFNTNTDGYVANGVPSAGDHHHTIGYANAQRTSGTANTRYPQTGTNINTSTDGAHTHNLPNHKHTIPANSHTHNFTQPTISTEGGSGVGKNMQPYIIVNRWHRTA